MRGFALLSLLALGCYHGEHYAVSMPTPAPAFPAELGEAAALAVADWEAHVPVQLNLTVSRCPSEPRPVWQVCFIPTETLPSLPWEPGTLAGITILNEVWLDVPRLMADDAPHRQRLIAHELGHAMGLQHDVAGTLMYPYSSEGSLTVTPQDVKQWHLVHPPTSG